MKKISLILAFILIIMTFSSCKPKEPPTDMTSSGILSNENIVSGESTKKTFSLPYFLNDSLNPYSAKQSLNFYLGGLLYEPLFELDSQFVIQNRIADSFTNIGNIVTVKIKSGVKFSDGSTVTIDDVNQSLSSAMSSIYYTKRLSNIATHRIKNQALEITLKTADINFVKNLNFPIIKGGSKANFAVGSGIYCFDKESNQKLILNSYNTQKKPKIESISLVEMHKYSTLPHMIKIGSVNFAYADGADLTTAATKTSPVLTNNLVYLGINTNNPLLANQDFRKAVSLSINRKNILADAYAGAGNITAQPFNPIAKDLNSADFNIDFVNTKAAAELISVVGLNKKDKDGILLGADEKPVTLRLAVNADNAARKRAADYIGVNLKAQGIAVEIIAEDSAKYKDRVAKGDYDIYIGEIKLAPDNNISSLLSVGALNMCNDGGETMTSYLNYLSGQITLEDFLRVFDLKTPYIPILYKNSMAVFSGTLQKNETVTEYNVFSDISNWTF